MYESWVAGFSESSGFSPDLLLPDPVRAAPSPFRLFPTGSALLRFAGDSNGFRSIWPERPGGEHADLINTGPDRNAISVREHVYGLHGYRSGRRGRSPPAYVRGRRTAGHALLVHVAAPRHEAERPRGDQGSRRSSLLSRRWKLPWPLAAAGDPVQLTKPEPGSRHRTCPSREPPAAMPSYSPAFRAWRRPAVRGHRRDCPASGHLCGVRRTELKTPGAADNGPPTHRLT